MSLLKRIERAQQANQEPHAETIPYMPPLPTSPAAPQGQSPVQAPPAPPPNSPPPTYSQAPAPPAPAGPLAAHAAGGFGAHAPAAPHSPLGAPGHSLVPTREDYLNSVRRRLLDQVMGARSLTNGDTTEVRPGVEAIIDRVLESNGFVVRREERTRLIDDVIAEIQGFGPIEPLLNDETITEVMVNGPNQVYIERKGKLELTNVVFRNEDHVMHIIDRIIAPLGRRIDESSPRVDARLPDGSRVNAVIAPLSLVGPVITVRKFSKRPYTVADLVKFGTSTAEMFDFLKACVEARLNIFVSGGTGSGKTTFLNVLSSFIPNDERIVTIEDAAELQLNQEHIITLESRPPNLEGLGEITIRHLLRNALHMRPDRVIVGECRGGEALDMLQAMNSGHDGSLSTGHANTPRDMLARLETMVLMAGYDMPLRSIREQITSAVDLIVHTARLKDGSRKVVNITEVYGIEEDEILTQDIFAWEQTAMVDGKVQGFLKPTGIRPTFMRKFKEAGVTLPPGEYGIPADDPAHPVRPRPEKARFAGGEGIGPLDPNVVRMASGRATRAGGMIYISSVGPVDPVTSRLVLGGIKDQTRQCLANLKARLEAEGSSMGKVVWANWSLRDPTEFDAFNKEWVAAFSEDAPIGQGTMMPAMQRRAGFRISIGVIAQQ
jgi:pilus assembly protein CpaF